MRKNPLEYVLGIVAKKAKGKVIAPKAEPVAAEPAKPAARKSTKATKS